jgi:hypothetical protein
VYVPLTTVVPALATQAGLAVSNDGDIVRVLVGVWVGVRVLVGVTDTVGVIETAGVNAVNVLQ